MLHRLSSPPRSALTSSSRTVALRTHLENGPRADSTRDSTCRRIASVRGETHRPRINQHRSNLLKNEQYLPSGTDINTLSQTHR